MVMNNWKPFAVTAVPIPQGNFNWTQGPKSVRVCVMYLRTVVLMYMSSYLKLEPSFHDTFLCSSRNIYHERLQFTVAPKYVSLHTVVRLRFTPSWTTFSIPSSLFSVQSSPISDLLRYREAEYVLKST